MLWVLERTRIFKMLKLTSYYHQIKKNRRSEINSLILKVIKKELIFPTWNLKIRGPYFPIESVLPFEKIHVSSSLTSFTIHLIHWYLKNLKHSKNHKDVLYGSLVKNLYLNLKIQMVEPFKFIRTIKRTIILCWTISLCCCLFFYVRP